MTIPGWLYAAALGLALSAGPAHAEDRPANAPASANAQPMSATVRLYAAGSLRQAMTDIARAFEAQRPGAVKVETEFGPSGLLRGRIETGETAHVFASADTTHPGKLAEQDRTQGAPRVFTRNALCAIARDGLGLDSGTLVDVLLQPATRVGISTPKADPSGDYALQVFQAVDKLRPGAGATLEAKALRLTGGPSSPHPPEGRQLYGWVMSSGQADVFLTYCTNARLARIDTPSLNIVALPPELAVRADYGLVVLQGAPPAAAELAAFITGPEGQKLLTGLGFEAGPTP